MWEASEAEVNWTFGLEAPGGTSFYYYLHIYVLTIVVYLWFCARMIGLTATVREVGNIKKASKGKNLFVKGRKKRPGNLWGGRNAQLGALGFWRNKVPAMSQPFFPSILPVKGKMTSQDGETRLIVEGDRRKNGASDDAGENTHWNISFLCVFLLISELFMVGWYSQVLYLDGYPLGLVKSSCPPPTPFLPQRKGMTLKGVHD